MDRQTMTVLLHYYFILFVLQLFTVNGNACGDNKIVNLSQGKIRGIHNNVYKYWTYMGVPYASFRGRFQEPGRPPSWNSTFVADKATPACIQYSPSTKTVIGEESCLDLNIYTPIEPKNERNKSLAVLLFIPGGAFNSGNNFDETYNARYLVQKDVVVVTIKYRVGAFGFLCLRNSGAPGNIGLKDQLAALKWVKNNIVAFGGNPDSITLFGQSVAASSIDFLIQGGAAKGLFQRAIMDSGTATRPLIFDYEPVLTASKAAARLGYNTTSTDELLTIFLNSSADSVAIVSNSDATNNALAPYIFKPCSEDLGDDNAIIQSNPDELLKSTNEISNISLIIGYNNKEGIMWAKSYDCNGLKDLENNFLPAIPNTLKLKREEFRISLINDIRKFYFGNSSINYNSLIDYFSDVLVIYPSVVTSNAYLENPKISMYNYYFEYDSLRNLRKLTSTLAYVPGADHTDELFYLFDPATYRYTIPIPKDMKMIERMTSLWTNFAKTGVPSTADIQWPRSETTLKYLRLDKDINVINLPNEERIEFWKKTSKKYLMS